MMPRMYYPVIDVRDVARAHIVALTAPNVSGRYIMTNGNLPFCEIGKRLGKFFPDYNPPTAEVRHANSSKQASLSFSPLTCLLNKPNLLVVLLRHRCLIGCSKPSRAPASSRWSIATLSIATSASPTTTTIPSFSKSWALQVRLPACPLIYTLLCFNLTVCVPDARFR